VRRTQQTLLMGLVAATILCGSDKKPPPVRSAENDYVEITATPLADREAVQQALGSDLGGYYIVMDVRLVPKEGRKVAVHLDDFVLKTEKDGSRTTPFVASQIAGRGALVVTEEGTKLDRVGIGPVTAGKSDVTSSTAKLHSGVGEKQNPLTDVLKQKMLPEKETEVPVSGLLYFPMDKQKAKDLELIYATPEGKLLLRFK